MGTAQCLDPEIPGAIASVIAWLLRGELRGATSMGARSRHSGTANFRTDSLSRLPGRWHPFLRNETSPVTRILSDPGWDASSHACATFPRPGSMVCPDDVANYNFRSSERHAHMWKPFFRLLTGRGGFGHMLAPDCCGLRTHLHLAGQE